MYTLGEAARAVGMSKPGIVKAIKSGRVSATRTDNGAYQIDPAELHRVYPVVGQPDAESSQELPDQLTVQLRGELDKWRVLAEERGETIRDLRARLDGEGEERRRMTALLLPPPPPVEQLSDLDRKRERARAYRPDSEKRLRLLSRFWGRP